MNHFNCIYLLRCNVTGKVYVGQAKDFNKRMNTHSSANGLCKKLYPAIKKYGWESFTQEILVENVENQDELNRLEVFYIEQYNSIEEGYNITAGGCGAKRPDGHNINFETGKYGISTLDPNYAKLNATTYYFEHHDEQLAVRRKYHDENISKISTQRKEYRKNNPEKIKEGVRRCWEKNGEKYLKQQKKHYEERRPEQLERRRKYYQSHKENWKKYRIDNRDEINRKKRERYQKNKEVENAKQRLRYAKQKAIIKNNGQMVLEDFIKKS